MKILVTGATGYIGKRLIPLLANENHHVVCAVRDKLRADKSYKDDEFIEEIPLPQLREISDVWDFAKDGKKFLNINEIEGFREYMRK